MNSMPPILFRDPTPGVSQAPPLIPPSAPGPDFDELASYLNNVLTPPDNAGEILINADEARQLRRLGWRARPGTWYAPLIPWPFIACYRLLWVLDDSIDPASRSIAWHFPRAAFIRPRSDDLGKLDRRILKLLAIHTLSRIGLQRRLWRIPGSIFNHALDRLITADRITLHEGLLHPFSRHRGDCQSSREGLAQAGAQNAAGVRHRVKDVDRQPAELRTGPDASAQTADGFL